MMTMNRLCQSGEGRPSNHWPSAEDLVAADADCMTMSGSSEGERHDLAGVGEEYDQPSSGCKAALTKRNFSTASSTGDEVTDSDGRGMELRKQKRLKANLNERKRSQGINDCIQEQAARLRQFTSLDVTKLGKKGIMQEFTKCFDQLHKVPKEALELALHMIRSQGTAPPMNPYIPNYQTNQPQPQPHPPTDNSGMMYRDVTMTNMAPMYVKPPGGVPSTPTSHRPSNMNTTPEQTMPIVTKPVTPAAPYGDYYHHMTPPGYPTPAPLPSSYVIVSQPGQLQTPPYYVGVPSTPSSMVMCPADSTAIPAAGRQPLVPNMCKKRSSEDSPGSDEELPPVKMARRATEQSDDVPSTPSRPACDRASISSNLAVLANVCELEREHTMLSGDNSSLGSRSDHDE